MTPSQGPADPSEPVHPESPLTAEEESEVTALLADAVGTEPVAPPAAVVARLDDVLVRLVEDRAAAARAAEETPPTLVPGPAGATVVPLGPRRRRLPRVLLAAAAVVLGGYAVGNVVLDGSFSGGGGDGDAASGAAGGATSDGGGATDSEQLGGGLAREEAMSLAPVVRADHLAADVRRVVRLLGPRSVVARPDDSTAGGRDGSVDETPDCPVPRLTDRQRHYIVRYQGDPAGLVLGPKRDGQVDATVYSCADGGVQLSRTVPAP